MLTHFSLDLVWKLVPHGDPWLSYSQKRKYQKSQMPNIETNIVEENNKDLLQLGVPEHSASLKPYLITNQKRTGALKTSLLSVVKKIISEENRQSNQRFRDEQISNVLDFGKHILIEFFLYKNHSSFQLFIHIFK